MREETTTCASRRHSYIEHLLSNIRIFLQGGIQRGVIKVFKEKNIKISGSASLHKTQSRYFFLKQFESVMIQVEKTSSNRFHEVQSLLRNTNSLASIKKHCRSGLCILSGKGKKAPSMERLQHVDV